MDKSTSSATIDYTQLYDELQFATQKDIIKQLETDEQILLACSLIKYNDHDKRQERNIMVTNKAVYNFSGSTIQRQIGMSKIRAITVGTLGSEFLLHVPDEYDYRYQSSDKRNRILYSIVSGYNKTVGAKLSFFFKEEPCLSQYATTKSDKKKSLNRMPTEGQKLMDENNLKVFIDGQIKENEQIRTSTSTLFSRDKKNVNLDDFNTIQVLGAGAFGMVLLVEEKKTKEWFAMKVIQKEVIIKKGQLEHTQTEQMVLEHVNHPYLVNLAYAFQDATRLFFVMQFMKGGELFQHLRIARKFPEKRAKFYAAQLALGLGHLHSKGIVYRDLQLENILMDEQGNVYVSDFGMAKAIKPDEVAMTFCGTPEYLSPEVILGQGCDMTTDWWSLGILTYEMMYGLPPFYHKNQTTMFKLIKEGELKFSEKVETTKEAKDFITRCLNRNKNERLGAQQDMKELLNHPWFKDLDMEKLLQKDIEPPFKPDVSEEQWMENFDKQFTSMNPRLADEDTGESFHAEKDPFKDF